MVLSAQIQARDHLWNSPVGLLKSCLYLLFVQFALAWNGGSSTQQEGGNSDHFNAPAAKHSPQSTLATLSMLEQLTGLTAAAATTVTSKQALLKTPEQQLSRSAFVERLKKLTRFGAPAVGKRRGDSSSLLLPGRPDNHNGCPRIDGGARQYRCPISMEDNVCINEQHLCNGRSECRHSEDEDPTMCLFYRFMNDSIRHLVNALVHRNGIKR